MKTNFIEVRPESEEEWLEYRRRVITATESGILLGLNPWKSVKKMTEDKSAYEPFENAYTVVGQLLEPVVVAAVNRVLETPYRLFEDEARSFFVDEEIGLGATPDAGYNGTLLECKTTKPHNYLKWAYWPPSYYLMQLYTQMVCTGRSHGLLAIMSTNLNQRTADLKLPLHIHEVRRDPWIDEVLFREVKRYWECRKAGKNYRVDRKQTLQLELKLRFSIKSLDFSNL